MTPTPATQAGRDHIAKWDAYRTEAKAMRIWEPADESVWAAERPAILAIEREASASAGALREALEAEIAMHEPDPTHLCPTRQNSLAVLAAQPAAGSAEPDLRWERVPANKRGETTA